MFFETLLKGKSLCNGLNQFSLVDAFEHHQSPGHGGRS